MPFVVENGIVIETIEGEGQVVEQRHTAESLASDILALEAQLVEVQARKDARQAMLDALNP